jgi:hypothetical protein
LLLQHFLPVRGGQFAPESGGQFPAESVVSLHRNQVVCLSEFSYDGDVLTVYEQEDIAGFISGSQKEMNELINSLSE